ncbi:inorganic triphosphatase [Oceanobacter mangrovi]|uniref:CYTH domain-containing protein n=1 Tax=Oceanobacter mangrovi TaxID=2862510 RepID=UPI001C8E8C31|nr:CYTH domain-containing protein [Oceanobacter mangrovi]
MTHEIELKLRFDPAAADRLANLLDQLTGKGDQFTLNNRYYDTPDARLSRAACALRVRQKGPAFEQTLKTRGSHQGGLSVRREWNWPLVSAELDEQLLQSGEVPQFWPAEVAVADLVALFSTNFERRRWLWSAADQQVEIVMDRGAVEAAGQQQPLCELELELLQGEPQCLWQLAQSLCGQVPLWISDISKAERGFKLVGMGRSWTPSSLVLPAEPNESEWLAALEQCDEGLQRALEACLWDQGAEAAAARPRLAHYLLLLQGLLAQRVLPAELEVVVAALDSGVKTLLVSAAALSDDCSIELSAALLALGGWLYDCHQQAPQLPVLTHSRDAHLATANQFAVQYYRLIQQQPLTAGEPWPAVLLDWLQEHGSVTH